MTDLYRTIEYPSEGSYKEKGSKFLAFAYPVSSEEEISQYRAKLRKLYHDARHHCYALLLCLTAPFDTCSLCEQPSRDALSRQPFCNHIGKVHRILCLRYYDMGER